MLGLDRRCQRCCALEYIGGSRERYGKDTWRLLISKILRCKKDRYSEQSRSRRTITGHSYHSAAAVKRPRPFFYPSTAKVPSIQAQCTKAAPTLQEFHVFCNRSRPIFTFIGVSRKFLSSAMTCDSVSTREPDLAYMPATRLLFAFVRLVFPSAPPLLAFFSSSSIPIFRAPRIYPIQNPRLDFLFYFQFLYCDIIEWRQTFALLKGDTMIQCPWTAGIRTPISTFIIIDEIIARRAGLLTYRMGEVNKSLFRTRSVNLVLQYRSI